MTLIERAARALHDRTVHVRMIRDCEHPEREPFGRVVAGRPWEAISDDEREKRIADARAVIAAIREPSEGMERAGYGNSKGDPDHTGCVDNPDPVEAYQNMIDALLAEGE